MSSLDRAIDKAIKEENRRALAGEPTTAESDPFLADFFSMTLEEIRQAKD